jgi:hypothetical protein
VAHRLVSPRPIREFPGFDALVLGLNDTRLGAGLIESLARFEEFNVLGTVGDQYRDFQSFKIFHCSHLMTSLGA